MYTRTNINLLFWAYLEFLAVNRALTNPVGHLLLLKFNKTAKNILLGKRKRYIPYFCYNIVSVVAYGYKAGGCGAFSPNPCVNYS